MLSRIVYTLVLCFALSSTHASADTIAAAVINTDSQGSQQQATVPHGSGNDSIATTLIVTQFEETPQDETPQDETPQSASLVWENGSNAGLLLQDSSVPNGHFHGQEGIVPSQSGIAVPLSLESLLTRDYSSFSSPTDSETSHGNPPLFRRHFAGSQGH